MILTLTIGIIGWGSTIGSITPTPIPTLSYTPASRIPNSTGFQV